ncbi:MAG: hypothetical protein GVY15_07250 [Bacteroidetes bacterium]|nr:hypothetical protein [Bacteroidota bacterium]
MSTPVSTSDPNRRDGAFRPPQRVPPKRPYVPPRLIREEPLDALTASKWTTTAHGGSP